MSKKFLFEKPAFTLEEQISLFEKRNLLIEDISEAKHYLSTIGYYRLMAYFKPFLIDDRDSDLGFRSNTSFNDVLNLYIFDRELRLLVSDAMERIEVALRAAISNIMSIKYGSHWYMDSNLFIDKRLHEIFLNSVNENLKKTKEDFIHNYYNKYYIPEHPPVWMVMECLSFGVVSKIYSNIKDRSARKEIADIFGIYSEIVKSWMKSLTYTRNLCAHHSRLWNRFFINKPKGVSLIIGSSENYSPFIMQAYIIIELLKKIAPDNHWKKKLFTLCEANTRVPFTQMGFSSNWRNDTIWSL